MTSKAAAGMWQNCLVRCQSAGLSPVSNRAAVLAVPRVASAQSQGRAGRTAPLHVPWIVVCGGVGSVPQRKAGLAGG